MTTAATDTPGRMPMMKRATVMMTSIPFLTAIRMLIGI